MLLVAYLAGVVLMGEYLVRKNPAFVADVPMFIPALFCLFWPIVVIYMFTLVLAWLFDIKG